MLEITNQKKINVKKYIKIDNYKKNCGKSSKIKKKLNKNVQKVEKIDQKS